MDQLPQTLISNPQALTECTVYFHCAVAQAASILDQLPQHVGGSWPGVATREDLQVR